MKNIKFGTKTVVYNVIEIVGGDSLNFKETYEAFFLLTKDIEQKKWISVHEIEKHPIRGRKWLVDIGAFVINKDRTLSRGERYDEVKRTFMKKKEEMYWER